MLWFWCGFAVILGLVVVDIVSLCCVLGWGWLFFGVVLLDLKVIVLGFEWFRVWVWGWALVVLVH